MAGRQVAREAGLEGDTVGQWHGWDVGKGGRAAGRQRDRSVEPQRGRRQGGRVAGWQGGRVAGWQGGRGQGQGAGYMGRVIGKS